MKKPITPEAFLYLKSNARHSMFNCVRGIPTVQLLGQEYGIHFSEKGLRVLHKKVITFF
ncbi:hypothetical protein HMPREF3226_00154 [Prevotella corporis]|uniref:Uncharacterized protein n=1 Tax=Prevotella corporis TaxID=28128 RepID=A0A133QND1_9BACT|nr:hypothetical protein HMPREF3226_00154 [Prevotella corporis]